MKLFTINSRVNRNGVVARIIGVMGILCLLLTQPATAQSNISYAEYYLDQDPGLSLATSIPITPALDVQNVAVTIDVNSLLRGVHIFGTRARTASGIWGMSHYWFIFKPYIAINSGSIYNITNVEYFIDQDPGPGNGTSVSITPATNLSNITFTINPTSLSPGVHIIGSRALAADGSWSHTNFWLFYNTYTNIPTPGVPANINFVEYFVDNDPGIGNATSVPVTPGINLSDVNLPVNITPLQNGVHLLGTRGKDAAGNWSMTNFWLFAKPYANIQSPALVNTTSMEYFLDYDPGYGSGIPVNFAPGTNLADLNFNVDVSTIIPGAHTVTVRAKDANNNWSMVNAWSFTIPGTPPILSSLVSTTTLCAGSPINVGYQLSAPITFNANNSFIAQLSDGNGSFADPIVIGSTAATSNAGSFLCNLPASLTQNSGYRIRVISTSQPIVGANNGNNITIYALPTQPVITGPSADTVICQGNQFSLTGTSNGSLQWLLNGVAIPGATSSTYTVANATTSNAGAYSLRATNAGSCILVSSVINISINTNVPSTPTVSPSGSIGVCQGNSQVLTSSAATNNQWYKNGLIIPGATAQTLAVTTAGTYTVRVSNGSCTAQSSNNAVITIGIPPTTPIVTIGGPTTFCQGGNVNFTSSAFTGNQWLKNGVSIAGATGQSYNATQTGYYKVMVSSASCNVYSDSTLVTVNPTLTPSVSVSTSLNNVPVGTNITITATPVNGGANPQYAFYLNNVLVQNSSANTYSSTSFASGNTIYCVLTSNVACASSTTATSNTVTINLLSNVLVSGRVSNPLGLIIPTVTMRLSGGITDSLLTDVNGKYNFSVYQQHNYTIAPNKNNDAVKASGINVLDVLQIQAHILGSTLLNSAYKVIAADVNSDNAINIFDLLLIKRLILGIDTSFPGGKLWAFVDSTQTFVNQNNPFPYNSSKSYTNITSAQINQSFIGIKLGDVTQDWAPVAGQNQPVTFHQPLQLYYDTTYLENSDSVRVRVRVRNFNNLTGMQFAMGFNTQSLKFTGIENRYLPLEYSQKYADNGVVTFIWADPANQSKTLPDGTVLFDLVFQQQQHFDREDINIQTSFTPPIAFNNDMESMGIIKTNGVILRKQIVPLIVDKEKFMVNPNPTTGLVKVSITSKANKNIVLVVTDVLGRILIEQSATLAVGTNDVRLDLNKVHQRIAGNYFIRITGIDDKASKEIIVIDK